MEQADLRPGQPTQIRGFADRRLRKSEDPLDPSNRRISLIVQYESSEEGKAGGNDEGSGKESVASTTKKGAESSPGAKSEQKKEQ